MMQTGQKMEYYNTHLTSDTSEEPRTYLCRRRRCTTSKFKTFQENVVPKPSRTMRFVSPRTFLQRTHFHEPWRESVLLVIVIMLLGSIQMTTAQVYLPSYSEYASTFEWVNPDSLDLEGLNVCLKERLSSAIDVLPRRKIIKDCESMAVFNVATCRALKDRRITLNDLYVRVTVVECCDGWLQGRTSCTQRCPPGTHGPGCRLTCRCAGQIQLGCHHETGDCYCPAGRTGKVCETTCTVAKNSYGPSCGRKCPTCKNGGVCDPVTGECLCAKGWTGRNCMTHDICIGTTCPINCAECDNESTCEVDLGICRCNPGWRGRYCTEPCPAGTFGSQCQQICTCLNNGVCLSEDGACVCATGWIGAHCETACPESYWGDQCENRCECPNNQCDPFTGECRCPKGRFGPMCVNECANSTYGRHCAKKCNCLPFYDCDPVSGVCYLVREIITTTPPPIVTNATTLQPTTTPIPIPTTPTEYIPTFIPIFSTTEAPATKMPSKLSTQVVLGTSLGGVLILAVLLTIAFVWIVFQRRDNTKSVARPFDPKMQNKNNNSEAPLTPGTTPGSTPSSSRTVSPAPSEIRPPIPKKPKIAVRKMPCKPSVLAKPIAIVSKRMSELGKEPVYETADILIENDMDQRPGSMYSYCDPKNSFSNPFYSAKKTRQPSRMSIPGSVRRAFASPFNRAATIHSSRGTAKAAYERGRGYEVPLCDIELKQKSSKKFPFRGRPKIEGGYLELSGELRDPASIYIALKRDGHDHMAGSHMS